MREDVDSADARHLGKANEKFPLTAFLARLIDMTNGELAAADPRRAAKWYGINPNYAAFAIRYEQAGRGVPMLQWEEVPWEPPAPPPPPPPPDRRFAAALSWGEECPHGVAYPKACETCEENIRHARGPVPSFAPGRFRGRR